MEKLKFVGDVKVNKLDSYFEGLQKMTINELEEAAFNRLHKLKQFEIKKVIFNEPATIVSWQDGTKTVVKCSDNDVFVPETGIALCFTKKLFGNTGRYNNVINKWAEQYYGEEEKYEAVHGDVNTEPTEPDIPVNVEEALILLKED